MKSLTCVLTLLPLTLAAPRNLHSIAYDEQSSYLEADILPDKTRNKMAVKDNHRLWPGGRMLYRLDFDTASNTYVKDAILRAVEKINDVACVNIVTASSSVVDYVSIQLGPDYSTHLGRQGGSQNLTVADDVNNVGTIMHELLHALGLGHEHNRPDRDEYVTVDFDNIKELAKPYFTKYTTDDPVEGDELKYDYVSLMHATNMYDDEVNIDMSKPVIWRNDGLEGLGQRNDLTELDNQRLKNLYSCDVCESAMSDTLLFKYPGDCSKFIQCSNGYSYTRDCSTGLHFSTKSQYCDYPALANCTSLNQ